MKSRNDNIRLVNTLNEYQSNPMREAVPIAIKRANVLRKERIIVA